MKYRVIIQPSAWSEITEAHRWLYDRSPTAANRWQGGLLRAIHSLETQPSRCARAPESESFGEEIRQLLYGRRGGVYRILFTIEEDVVSVLYVRHGARRPLSPDRLDDEENGGEP
jgi:plasmid stabilization system protein ParE